MSNLDYLLEHYRNQLGVSKEEEELLIEELKKTNPVTQLETKLGGEIGLVDERTIGMQEIDAYTLDQTFLINDRTEGMQEIDQFTLDMVFVLEAKIQELEQRIATLEGGI